MHAAFLLVACYLVEAVICRVNCGSDGTVYHHWHHDVGTSLG